MVAGRTALQRMTEKYQVDVLLETGADVQTGWNSDKDPVNTTY